MMQFKINNEFLELPADFGLQFTRKNPLFAFDALECERTVSFDIPATPKNDRIFELARWVQARGAGMRRRYDAQLQGSMVTKDGYLYISEYSDGKYKAVFVTGELLGLQRIKALDKIPEIMTYQQTTPVSNSGGTPSALAAYIWASVQYRRPSGETLSPSISLQKLYETICAQYNINAAAFPSELAGMRIVPAKAKGIKKGAVEFTGTGSAMTTDGTYPVCYSESLNLAGSVIQTSPAHVAVRTNDGATVYTGTALQFLTYQKLKITFPDDWNDDLFIGYFITHAQGEEYLLQIFDFYGDRSFDETGSVTGESLRGRTVEIPTQGLFAIINKRDYAYLQTSGGLEQGWAFASASNEATFSLEGMDIQVGDYVRLQDNLPDITFTELLKVIAALCGRVLNYDETNGVTFDALNLATFSVLDVSDIIKTSALTRTFADYAQNNIITLKDEPDDVRTVYTIDNENIETEKTLLTIPFDAAQTLNGALYIENAEADTIGATGTQYLTRVQLIKNNGLQSLCNASTALSAQIRMTLFEFNQLNAKTAIRMRGVRYTWTEAQWAKDVATIKLAKMYQ